MAATTHPLRIVIVSPDLGVLHDLSWMLSAVGYSVATSKDIGAHALWRRFCDVDFVVLDGRSVSHPTDATFGHESDNPIYRIFLYDPSAAVDFASWFAAGANDAVRVPVSRGELLARIRTGARMLEFERRMRRQSTRSSLPRMYSKHGLLRALKNLAADGSVVLGHTLLTTSIDLFHGLCREEGQSAARSLVAALATTIEQTVATDAIAAYVGDGTFHVVLRGQTSAAARTLAERISKGFCDAQSNCAAGARFSLSTAIVAWQIGVTPPQLLTQGEETLAIARQSGGDCTLEHNAYSKEIAAWQNELTGGSPFGNLTAQDIMEPFALVLQHSSDNSAMVSTLRRSGVPVWPYVDGEGKLVGVGSPELPTGAIVRVGSNGEPGHPITSPVTIENKATFPEIYETFSTQGCLEMVVVADRCPIGYLTLDGFFSLIEPIDSTTYSGDEPATEDSRSLLVGSAVKTGGPVSGSDR